MDQGHRSLGVKYNAATEQARGTPAASVLRQRPTSASGIGTGNKTKHNITLPLPHTKRATPAKKAGKHADSSRPCREHSFLTDVADVRQMEQGLMQLLDDFHTGRLQAFGKDSAFERMDQVREQQERLARLHFELDSQQEIRGFDSEEARDSANNNLGKLMNNLQELCSSIQNLQKDDEQHTPHPAS